MRKDLEALNTYPQIQDEIKTVDLLLNSIVKKLTADGLSHSRKASNTAKKNQYKIQ